MFFFLSIFWMFSAFGLETSIRLDDVGRIMNKFFQLHIENKELNEVLIQRAVKLYIEQFDADKSYLLESEVNQYLHLDKARASQIVERVRKGDYRDFFELNEVFAKSIVRARVLRKSAMQNVISGKSSVRSSYSPKYATSQEEILIRQQQKLVRFYSFHEMRTNLSATERKAKVCELFEKKVRRFEAAFLFLDAQGAPLPQEKVEHFMSLKILKSLAKSLDTHTAFFSPEEAQEMRLTLEKQFEGVGVVLSEGIDGVMISDLIEGSPAKQSGQIQVNDLLVEIDHHPIQNLSFEDVLDLLKKKDHPEIILGFKREGSSEKNAFFRVSLMKKPISMREERIKVSYEEVDGGIIGKIALHSFYESSDGTSSERDIKEAIRSLRQIGNLQGLILDLRENSGGFLGQAVRVASLFLANGVVVISKYGQGDVHYLRNLTGKSYFGGPLVVLTSQMSASAAEIVAQSLQDYGVALIVGDKRTFGKGSIQYQTITDENADYFFKVTVGRYYTVSGKSAQIEGVLADIVVPTPYAPYHIGERYLEYPLTPDQVESAYVDRLQDVEERLRPLFEKRYLPYLQRSVSFWKKALPELRNRSQARISKNPEFQAFLMHLEEVRMRQGNAPVNSIDEPVEMGMHDLQMQEATQIMQDMIEIEASAKSSEQRLLPTG
jgi:carboxyl-terminal processing protease